jgi:rubrerythrin
MRRPIRTIEEFYANALAIEREAAERYSEFAAYFADRGEDVLAGLCRNLASMERAHYHQLIRASDGLTLPVIEMSGYRWLESGAPETSARQLFYRVANPRQLLEIALGAELRARAFFVGVSRHSPSPAVRQLASVMAAEECEHVRWVREALEYHPADIDWEKSLAHGVGPGTFAPN